MGSKSRGGSAQISEEVEYNLRGGGVWTPLRPASQRRMKGGGGRRFKCITQAGPEGVE